MSGQIFAGPGGRHRVKPEMTDAITAALCFTSAKPPPHPPDDVVGWNGSASLNRLLLGFKRPMQVVLSRPGALPPSTPTPV